MKLFDYQTFLPHAIDDVFALTVDLENAPHWHSIFTDVQQLTPDSLGLGSSWRVSYGLGSFTLDITEYQPPNRVVFKGSPVWGTTPNFTIMFQAVAEGTEVHYLLHPVVPNLLEPLVALVAPPYGRRDLDRYFREMNTALAHH